MIRGDVIQKPSDLCSGLGITKTFITYPVKLVVENPIPLNIESPYLITITSEVRSFERTGFVKGHNCLQFKQDSNKLSSTFFVWLFDWSTNWTLVSGPENNPLIDRVWTKLSY